LGEKKCFQELFAGWPTRLFRTTVNNRLSSVYYDLGKENSIKP
jgi:hypothetical protein